MPTIPFNQNANVNNNALESASMPNIPPTTTPPQNPPTPQGATKPSPVIKASSATVTPVKPITAPAPAPLPTAPVPPAKTGADSGVKSNVYNADGSTTVTYNDGTTTKLPASSSTTGTPPAGMTATDYANFKTANPGKEPTTDDINKANLAQAQADYQTQAKSVTDTISSIQNGTVPLTTGEQAQVDGLKQQFQQLIDSQNVTNKGATGLANVRGYQTGAGEYDPMFQAKTIGTIVTAGQNKIADLNIKMASAVATLTQSFKDNDIKAVKDAWDMYQVASKERTDALTKTIADTQQAVKDAQAEADKLRDYDLNVDKFNYDMKHNDETLAETVKKDAFDNAYKMEDLALKKQANNIAATNLPVVQTTPTGKPDTLSQQNFLNSLPGGPNGAMGTGIKALTDYTILPDSFSSRAGPNGTPSQRQQFITMAKQYDPSYDENQAQARAAYIKNVQSGTLSQAIVSANKSISHLITFANDVTDIGNGGVSSKLNAAGNWIESPFSSSLQTNLTQATTEASGVKDELAKFFKGSGTTDVKSIEDWSDNLTVNATPSQLKGTVQGAINLLAGQLDVLNQQYTATVGKPPGNTILQPATVAKLSDLKNKGYEVDIPGVLYTDPQSYVKNDPNGATNLKNVITAYPQLSQEDALQLAQSLNQ